MFDTIVSSLAQQFGLGDKARPFVQMLLAHMSDPARGGLSGFIQRLRTSSGAGVVDSWLAAPAEPAAVAGPVVERALDGDREPGSVPPLRHKFITSHAWATQGRAGATSPSRFAGPLLSLCRNGCTDPRSAASAMSSF